jgi:hypothetical protein
MLEKAMLLNACRAADEAFVEAKAAARTTPTDMDLQCRFEAAKEDAELQKALMDSLEYAQSLVRPPAPPSMTTPRPSGECRSDHSG